MVRTYSRRIVRFGLIIGALTLAPNVQAARAEEIKVSFLGLRNENGEILVALFDSAEGFPVQTGQAIASAKLPARSWREGVAFRNLRPGRYAVIAMHDEDDNGKMTKTFLGLPAEGFGISNNPTLFGQPRFRQAAFDLKGTETLEIKIKYF